MTAVLRSESIQMGGLVVDFKTWAWVAAGALALSALFWVPFALSLTRSVAHMTAATSQIAQGNFDARAPAHRRDELGDLALAINQMAERLAGFVGGQKRFLGDIAHELCSPLARIQMIVGILEERTDSARPELVQDLREEVQQMSHLVNELLSFSKASLGHQDAKLVTVNLAECVGKAVAREAEAGITIENKVSDTFVAGGSDLLVRAISNVLRNAVRYAGTSGPIVINAIEIGDRTELRIRDHGPGVPESELGKLFDPFYRVDTSRTRETGGVGLGLAIVKTCIEACRGTVSCRNANPGLEVTFTLQLATPGDHSLQPEKT